MTDRAPERKPNRLAREKSPYLLQHRLNPVDWHPWGEEAFARAREADRPVFLSIGYSTCHWCHVMERESFEDEAIAALMNEQFVCVKVDREERPDVDQVYMAAVQAMTGSGGWPLSVALAPDGRPFWGGTYFPPEDRYGRPGFPTVLRAIAGAWAERREEVLEQAGKLTDHLRAARAATREAEVGAETLAKGFEDFAARFDRRWGGFEGRPKFPRAHGLSFLLRQGARRGDGRAREMVCRTLDMMTRGGIHDHVGGGFHRYSTDERWLVPHFEKMLYDQAIAVRALVEARQVTGEERYAATARGTVRYVLRDLADPAGGFHSAEDADSEGEEGRFYVWTRAEILEVLGEEDGALLAETCGVRPEGNWTEESTGERMPTNILHLPRALHDVAAGRGIPEEALRDRLAPLLARLREAREDRVRPLRDDKVLADWNGLMIGSLAVAGAALDEPEFLRAAERAADFVLREMVRDGRLLHRWRDGEAAVPGFLDDYAFLSAGLLDLYEATLSPRWLRESKRLGEEMIGLFLDREGGGFLFAAADGERLVAESKEVYDGAVPSGNSVAALTLLRLGRLTADAELTRAGEATVRTFSGHLERAPSAFPVLLAALDELVGPGREIVLAGDPEDPAFRAMLAEVRRRHLPRTVLAANPGGEAGAEIARLAPFLAEQGPVDGRPAAYVCEGYACRRPVTGAGELASLLDAG